MNLFGRKIAVTTNICVKFCRVKTTKSGRQFVKVWGDWYELLPNGDMSPRQDRQWKWTEL